MDLITKIALNAELPSARGRRSGNATTAYSRDLTPADFEVLMNPPPKGAVTSPLVKLRATHHALARLMAEGRPQQECSEITGYSPSRISILKNDPAFSELVEYYRGEVKERFFDVQERLASLGLASLDELQDRLDSDPDSFTNKELRELAESLLDRTVAPSKTNKPGAGGNLAAITVQIGFVQAQSPGEATLIDISPDRAERGTP